MEAKSVQRGKGLNVLRYHLIVKVTLLAPNMTVKDLRQDRKCRELQVVGGQLRTRLVNFLSFDVKDASMALFDYANFLAIKAVEYSERYQVRRGAPHRLRRPIRRHVCR